MSVAMADSSYECYVEHCPLPTLEYWPNIGSIRYSIGTALTKNIILYLFFICSLFNDAFSVTLCSVEWKEGRRKMNCKDCEMKRSCPNFKLLFQNSSEFIIRSLFNDAL
jgi:hypothetical protein